MKFGLGIVFGSGEQWQSWIHIEDISRIFLFMLEKDLSGVYNGVSKNPLTNLEFTRVISSNFSIMPYTLKIPRIFFKIYFFPLYRGNFFYPKTKLIYLIN